MVCTLDGSMNGSHFDKVSFNSRFKPCIMSPVRCPYGRISPEIAQLIAKSGVGLHELFHDFVVEIRDSKWTLSAGNKNLPNNSAHHIIDCAVCHVNVRESLNFRPHDDTASAAVPTVVQVKSARKIIMDVEWLQIWNETVWFIWLSGLSVNLQRLWKTTIIRHQDSQ
jgi:hypothetical protein